MDDTLLLGIKVFGKDFYKMLTYFFLNLGFISLIINGLYYPRRKRNEYVFAYYMVGIVVFLLCFTLKKFDLGIGMALGLFAIFGIMRYRTDTIAIKEMTYLFVIIGVSVINALINKKTSFAEVLLGNAIVVLAIFLIENFFPLNGELSRRIVYESTENTHADNHQILKAELERRTGLSIQRLRIGEVDYVKNKVDIIIYFKEEI